MSEVGLVGIGETADSDILFPSPIARSQMSEVGLVGIGETADSDIYFPFPSPTFPLSLSYLSPLHLLPFPSPSGRGLG